MRIVITYDTTIEERDRNSDWVDRPVTATREINVPLNAADESVAVSDLVDFIRGNHEEVTMIREEVTTRRVQ